jgi:uncharacterized protein (TIGR03086 family)
MDTEAISVVLLTRAVDRCGELIAAIRPEQAEARTPCRSFNLRQLVNHVVFDLQRFTAMNTGAPVGDPGADLIGSDWSAAYRSASEELLATWREPDALEKTTSTPIGELDGTFRISQQISDVAVHSWDIATATGRPADLDDEVVRLSLDWARRTLHPMFRGAEADGKAFGPEVAVPEDASPQDRLVAFFGRNPN